MQDTPVHSIHSNTLEDELTLSSATAFGNEILPTINDQLTANAAPASSTGAVTPGGSTPKTKSTLPKPCAPLTKSARPAKSSGPKSLAGKQKSARNAFKSGFYSKGLLPWEDAKAQETQWHALVDYYHAYDPVRVGLLRTLEFALLQQERLMVMEREKIAGAMQSVDVALEFVKRANLPLASYVSMPAWFFKLDDAGEKAFALKIARIHREAIHFKNHYSDHLAGQVREHYPHLFDYVMDGERPGTSFAIALGQEFKQPTPVLNLGGLINELQDDYPHHLTWADDPEHYQYLINGLRVEVVERVVDWDRSSAQACAIQQRILKCMAGLAALDQHDAQRRAHRQAQALASAEEEPIDL